jgi:hypothetical protein
MCNSRSVITLTILLISAVPVLAVDLTKIDRAIGKQPTYEFQPVYCLLVFGSEAKTRAWLVLDGDTLYVSGSTGGELTKATKRSIDGRRYYHQLITESDGKTTHDVSIRVFKSEAGSWYASILAHSPMEYVLKQTTYVNEREIGILLANSPKSAPVIHLDGSYTSTLRERGVISNGQWIRNPGKEESVLHVLIGSNVLTPGQKAFVRTWWLYGIPDELRPVAEMQFPHQEANQEPIKMRVRLVFR